jgi:hypothetical protein
MKSAMINPPSARRIPDAPLIRIGVAATVMLCLMSGGCVAAIGAGTVAATNKMPIDHLVSLVTGKDCSVVRQHRGLTYCIEDEVTPAVRVHCYPTLGEVTCYAAPDPFPGGQRELGGAQAVAVIPGR